MTYSFTCTCGDTMTADAESRDEAVGKFKGMMDANGIAKHFADKHPGQPPVSVEENNAMIEQAVKEA